MESWVRSLLFQLDPENAHECAISLLKHCPSLFRHLPQTKNIPHTPVTVFDMVFSSPIGLAAGFDKNAECLEALYQQGFGFVEIGTVTPLPQPGNPKPRLFRDIERQSLFNRMGFNSKGSEVVRANLSRFYEKRSTESRDFRIGLNIGKNKDTSPEYAHHDYKKAALALRNLGDYVVINVSSPNTPGLRALQSVDSLLSIVEEVSSELVNWQKRPPLLIKLAPEVSEDRLREVLSHSHLLKNIQGWVLGNTLEGQKDNLKGGWSGKILTETSKLQLQEARSMTSLPIVSVGGIMNATDMRERFALGSSLIQVYSGWIYGGLNFVKTLHQALVDQN
jgi:dihydroorotate dehydrogenase